MLSDKATATGEETPMPPNEPAPTPFTDDDRAQINEMLAEPWDRETRIHDNDKPALTRALAYIDHLEGDVWAPGPKVQRHEQGNRYLQSRAAHASPNNAPA